MSLLIAMNIRYDDRFVLFRHSTAKRQSSIDIHLYYSISLSHIDCRNALIRNCMES